MNFNEFKVAVAKQFATMVKDSTNNLFTTNLDKDKLWSTYLESFPEGTNPIYDKRTEHDCSCCKQFIRNIGNVVALTPEGGVISIWDIDITNQAYQTVANALSKKVKDSTISGVFRHYEKTVGTDKNYSREEGKPVKTWEHFFVNLPERFVEPKKNVGTLLGNYNSTFGVFNRALNEFTVDALETVIELIEQGSLYRGNEHLNTVKTFLNYKKEYDSYTNYQLQRTWYTVANASNKGILHIRGTVIGALIENLSNGMELEEAVKKYESYVAPTNYKRPTALVTKIMVDNAKAKIKELGLESALNRRYAINEDINVNNILFINRNNSVLDTKDVFDTVTTKSSKKLDKVEEVTIKDFIANILPKATKVELMMDNIHSSNLVSLTTSVDPTAINMFQWNNNIGWSYNGDVTDSIKERVKKAGGNVSGDLCCRLSWFNRDDLDLSMVQPNGNMIYFSNRICNKTGGQLDVDMNVRGETREPVENIFYTNCSKMIKGNYTLQVHNFKKRETTDIGFEIEIDAKGTVYNYSYDKPVKTNERITVAVINWDGTKFTVVSDLEQNTVSKNYWGINTNTFTEVEMIMPSPNHWDNKAIGNLHYFFILKDCANPVGCRGFYNEFLKQELTEHRKVLEIVGSRITTKEDTKQLSGLGFSYSQRNNILCRVQGTFNRTVKILF